MIGNYNFVVICANEDVYKGCSLSIWNWLEQLKK